MGTLRTEQAEFTQDFVPFAGERVQDKATGMTAIGDGTTAVSGLAFGVGADGGSTRLAHVTGINAKNVANTNLYTVPAGRKAVITGARVTVTAATAITVAPAGGIGQNGAADDIFASATLTGLTAAGAVFTFQAAAGAQAGQVAAAVIKFGIDTAATGTSETVTVDLFGYLI